MTQVKQLDAGSVLGWVTAGPRPAHRNAEREVIFQETVDWGRNLLNGRLYWHKFSAVFLFFPCANTIHHRKRKNAVTFSGGGGKDLWRDNLLVRLDMAKEIRRLTQPHRLLVGLSFVQTPYAVEWTAVYLFELLFSLCSDHLDHCSICQIFWIKL